MLYKSRHLIQRETVGKDDEVMSLNNLAITYISLCFTCKTYTNCLAINMAWGVQILCEKVEN